MNEYVNDYFTYFLIGRPVYSLVLTATIGGMGAAVHPLF